MNTLNFDNIACVISLFVGLGLGFWLSLSFCSFQRRKYEKIISDLDRKNKKLIHFIKFKLNR